MKILFVDDEPDVELMVRQRLRRKAAERGIELHFAQNGAEAIDQLRTDEEIGLVFSDINMPVMDGLTLVGRVNELNRVIKIVVVSAYGDLGNIRAAMNRGAFDFLTKPIDFADLTATIDKADVELGRIKQGRLAEQQLSILRNELVVASRIQQAMLPRTVEAPRVDIHAEMIAARSVGGDFYDFFKIDERHLAVTIGDVSGKGVPAALLMSAARTHIRGAASQGLSAGECVTKVNRLLARESDPTMFVTLFYGVLDIHTGQLQCTLGGHHPPLLVSASGSTRVADIPAGLVVGLVENVSYESHCLQLEPGEALVLYTDGISEAENEAAEEFSTEQLIRVVNELRMLSPTEMTRQIIGTVKRHAGAADQSDDMTVVCLRYLPE